ncbi:response regulator [Roseospirillum parvum]|uniref:Putative two-component system response regulator n=1 Tax=Roseospirillum parvum TaxID=83401 RepID=A0A1G7YKM9_9PROT|nr:HD domain-containing phosphohydrolase [Roseospirillum parvum]SDG96927.1 putative two-component system response regulator [Roseospirillum parvum]
MTRADAPTLLLVDDQPANLAILKEILKEDHHLLFARDGQRALELAAEHHPDLILLDVMMPGMDGFEVCRRLKSVRATRPIPVIFVTAMTELKDEAKGFALGAVDYISKPVRPPIVRARVTTQLTLNRLKTKLAEEVRARVRQHERVIRASVQMLGDAGHYNDNDTGVHIWRMAAYARALASAAGWGEEDCDLLELAAPMHDTGKIAIPDAILKKPASLDPGEWAVMHTHPRVGSEILGRSDSPLFVLAAQIAEHHHEKWDGTGYPDGLAGEAIPQAARIVALCDVFDALTMRRPYKEPWPVERALQTIHDGRGRHFDPELVDLFDSIRPEILTIKAAWDAREQGAGGGTR